MKMEMTTFPKIEGKSNLSVKKGRERKKEID